MVLYHLQQLQSKKATRKRLRSQRSAGMEHARHQGQAI
jgi:hypothetical protein